MAVLLLQLYIQHPTTPAPQVVRHKAGIAPLPAATAARQHAEAQLREADTLVETEAEEDATRTPIARALEPAAGVQEAGAGV